MLPIARPHQLGPTPQIEPPPGAVSSPNLRSKRYHPRVYPPLKASPSSHPHPRLPTIYHPKVRRTVYHPRQLTMVARPTPPRPITCNLRIPVRHSSKDTRSKFRSWRPVDRLWTRHNPVGAFPQRFPRPLEGPRLAWLGERRDRCSQTLLVTRSYLTRTLNGGLRHTDKRGQASVGERKRRMTTESWSEQKWTNLTPTGSRLITC